MEAERESERVWERERERVRERERQRDRKREREWEIEIEREKEREGGVEYWSTEVTENNHSKYQQTHSMQVCAGILYLVTHTRVDPNLRAAALIALWRVHNAGSSQRKKK